MCVCSEAKFQTLEPPEAGPPALDMLKLAPDFSEALQHHLHLHQVKYLGSYLEDCSIMPVQLDLQARELSERFDMGCVSRCFSYCVGYEHILKDFQHRVKVLIL